MSFLENLKKNNQFLILFIGSGITKRYFKDAPSWDELLNTLWNELSISKEKSYYYMYQEIHKEYENDFLTYIKLATELEKYFDSDFYSEKIIMNNLTPKEAHNNKVSPFRTRIASIFSSLTIKEEYKDEIKIFTSMLSKARIIITTNYDTFIEDRLNNAIKVRVGSNGLFENAGDLNELFKIHGSVKEKNSIVITESDYDKMKRSSAILNAKILSLLTESPIIFFGYSLTDKNIRSLLIDLTDNMPFSIEEAANRIGVVEYVKDKRDITEIISKTDFDAYYTQISTDNFKEIYSHISKIDQGISPLELSKYKDSFKKIIESKGEKGELKHVLTSYVDLDKLPEELLNKKLVVAFGDSRYIYKFPDYVEYIKSYFKQNNLMPLEIALKFILQSPSNSYLPVSKYLMFKPQLDKKHEEKINKRLSKCSSLETLKKSINIPKNQITELNKFIKEDLYRFLKNDKFKLAYKINCCILNIESIDADYVLDFLLKQSDIVIRDTVSRKFFMAYSLLKEKIYIKYPEN